MDTVQHFEIPYQDKARARSFYQDLFGWSFFDVPGRDYTFTIATETHANGMPKHPGSINGALMPRTVTAPAPVLLIRVPDAKVHMQRIVDLGGSVVQPVEQVGNLGYYGRFRDTEGNVLAVWQLVTPEPEPARTKPKTKAPARKVKPAVRKPAAKKAKGAGKGAGKKRR